MRDCWVCYAIGAIVACLCSTREAKRVNSFYVKSSTEV